MQLLLRDATAALRRLARGFPVVAVTGPRQSGKTTLVRATFPGKAYVSLEDPDERALAVAEIALDQVGHIAGNRQLCLCGAGFELVRNIIGDIKM
jgi:AAA domain